MSIMNEHDVRREGNNTYRDRLDTQLLTINSKISQQKGYTDRTREVVTIIFQEAGQKVGSVTYGQGWISDLH